MQPRTDSHINEPNDTNHTTHINLLSNLCLITSTYYLNWLKDTKSIIASLLSTYVSPVCISICIRSTCALVDAIISKLSIYAYFVLDFCLTTVINTNAVTFNLSLATSNRIVSTEEWSSTIEARLLSSAINTMQSAENTMAMLSVLTNILNLMKGCMSAQSVTTSNNTSLGALIERAMLNCLYTHSVFSLFFYKNGFQRLTSALYNFNSSQYTFSQLPCIAELSANIDSYMEMPEMHITHRDRVNPFVLNEYILIAITISIDSLSRLTGLSVQYNINNTKYPGMRRLCKVFCYMNSPVHWISNAKVMGCSDIIDMVENVTLMYLQSHIEGKLFFLLYPSLMHQQEPSLTEHRLRHPINTDQAFACNSHIDHSVRYLLRIMEHMVASFNSKTTLVDALTPLKCNVGGALVPHQTAQFWAYSA